LTAFVDSNVLVRHLTGDPPRQAQQATEFVRGAESLIRCPVAGVERSR